MKLTIMLAVIAGIAFSIWYAFGDSGKKDAAGQASSLLGALRGEDSVDPSTGTTNGLLNSIDNYLVNESNPGGGEVKGSSETYTGAASTVLSDPIGSLKSILGF